MDRNEQALKAPTFATQIHPHTGQKLADTVLPAGTAYTPHHCVMDEDGWYWLMMEVSGYWFVTTCPYSHLPTDAWQHPGDYRPEEEGGPQQ